MERWDAYNKYGEKLNTALTRGEAIPVGMYHLVVQCMVKHTNGDYLIMQRAHDKDLFPSLYELTAGGSALIGENSITALKRELFEETGIVSRDIRLIERTFCNHNMFDLYLVIADIDKEQISYQTGETIDHNWLTLPELVTFFESDQCIAVQKKRNHYLKRILTVAPIYPLFEQIKSILSDNFVGIYLHGSICLDDFDESRSDIDFLVVSRDTLLAEQRHQIIKACLSYDNLAPVKGVEMSVLTLNHCKRFTHPCPFELHYSVTHKKAASADIKAYCDNMHGTDSDLAVHIALTRQVGIEIFGPMIHHVFGVVPEQAIRQSIKRDLSDSLSAPLTDQANLSYVVANICRSYYYLEHQRFISKTAGLHWASDQSDVRLRRTALLATQKRLLSESEIEDVQQLAERCIHRL